MDEYLYPAEKAEKATDFGFVPGYPKPRMFTVTSCLNDDPDVQQITVSVLLKPDSPEKVDSFVVERAALKWLANHTPAWVDYLRKHQMLTLN